MFITRKRFEEKIREAVCEAREKDRMYDRMNYLESELHRRMDALEKRIYSLERLHSNTPTNDDPVEPNPIGY